MIRVFEIKAGSTDYPVNKNCVLEIPIAKNGYFSIQTIWEGLNSTDASVEILKTNESSRKLANAVPVSGAGFSLNSYSGNDFVDTQMPLATEYLLYSYNAGSNTQGVIKVLVKQL